MDGLECSIISFKQLFSSENFTVRIDSEYYKKSFISAELSLKRKSNIRIIDTILKVTGGKRLPLNETFSSCGVKYARAEDVKNDFLEIDKSPYISFSLHRELNRYTTKKGDILLTIVGNSIGDVAINLLDDTINLTENCVRIDNAPIALFVFFKSVYGQTQIQREKVGTAQPKLAIERIRNFLVPEFTCEFNQMIQGVVLHAWTCYNDAKVAYKKSEKILSRYLVGNDKYAEDNAFSIISLSESFLRSGRLDAEYYQPKYDTLFDNLAKFATKKLGGEDGIVQIKKSIEPGSEAYQDEGIPFIRVSDIDKFGISKTSIRLSHDIVPVVERLYPKKDTILLSKDGSVGIAYKVNEDMQIVTSGALLHLTVKDKSTVLPDYLTLVLNSPIGQLQAERDCNGAIIQHWKPSDIENVIIPILDIEKQKEIADEVQESFRLRKEAKRLLDNAVKAVEMAIETNEEKAMRWLELQD